MNEKILVHITANQIIRYDQIVEIDRDRWKEIKEIPEHEIESEYTSPLSDMLDLHDIKDWDNFEDVEMTVVDKNGKPVKPLDQYMGE